MWNSVVAEAVRFREELHRMPEASGEEFCTCTAIRRELSEIPGVCIVEPFLKTDTVAFIDGNSPGRNVVLRADIDALAVKENTGVDFTSENSGMMHACGHDVHAAILLGCAKILASERHKFSGSVQLVFQPGEESLAMARDLIAAGALRNPEPDFVAALHVEPGLPVGTIALKSGCMASACKHYQVQFSGKGGHGSMPHLARNPVLAAAAAINELQYVVNTWIEAGNPAVLSVCSINGGSLDNVIPQVCSFSGTLRCFDNGTAEKMLVALKDICESVAKMHRMQCTVVVRGDYPALINPHSGFLLAVRAAENAGLKVRILEQPAMSSEDFSCFLQNSPDGVFVRLGAGENQPPLHNSKFLPPAEIIEPGIRFLTAAALCALEQK